MSLAFLDFNLLKFIDAFNKQKKIYSSGGVFFICEDWFVYFIWTVSTHLFVFSLSFRECGLTV